MNRTNLLAAVSLSLALFTAGCGRPAATVEPVEPERFEARKPIVELAAEGLDDPPADSLDDPVEAASLPSDVADDAPSQIGSRRDPSEGTDPAPADFDAPQSSDHVSTPVLDDAEPASESELAERQRVLEVIDETVRQQELRELRGRLSDSNVDVRFVAVAELADRAVEEPAARQALVAAFDDENMEVVISARRALRETGAAAIPELVAALEHESQQVQLYSVQTIAGLEPAEAAEAIAALLGVAESGDSALRAAAVAALARCGGGSDEVLASLTKSLQDPDSKVRANAARALGELGERAKGAVDALEQLTHDKDYWAARAAKQALRSIAPAPPKGR